MKYLQLTKDIIIILLFPLIVVLVIAFAFNILFSMVANAQVFSDDFDDYSLGYNINDDNEWSADLPTCIIVTDDYASSSPHSLKNCISGDSDYRLDGDFINDELNAFGYIKFDFFIDTGTRFEINQSLNDLDGNYNFKLQFLNTAGTWYLNVNDGNSTQQHPIGAISSSTWHSIEVYYNFDGVNFMSVKVDDTLYNTYTSNQASTNITHYFFDEFSSTRIYFDNFILSSTTYDEDEEFFNEIELITLPEWQGNIQVGSEELLQYNKFTTCIIGQDCYFRLNYGYDAIGNDIQLYIADPLELYATTTLPDQDYLTVLFEMDSKMTEDEELYCIVMDDGVERVGACDIKIEWVDLPYCDELEVCADVATTSDFMFGFQCGFRKSLCWMFNPHDISLNYIVKGVRQFEQSFPFNLAFGFLNETEEILDTATSSDGFPILWMDEYGDYTNVIVATSGTMIDVLGEDTGGYIQESIKYIIWIFCGAITLFIIVKTI
jgi:hypothetical protein